MTITERQIGAVTILDLPPRFMVEHGLSEFREKIRALLEDGHTKILVNYYTCAYMDSAGIAELIKAYGTVRDHGGTIKLVNLTKRIGPALFDLAKLLTVFENYDDETEGVASFGARQS